MSSMHPARHLLRAKDPADSRYFEPLSVGSFTTSFGRTFGLSPTAYRAAFPPAAAQARIPDCLLRAWGRPHPQTARLEKTGRGGAP
jgi:hypothetical protein